MMESFLGLPIHILLKNSSVIEGRICSIDKNTQEITLENVMMKTGGKTHYYPELSIDGSSIMDLSLLPGPQNAKEDQTSVSSTQPTYSHKESSISYAQQSDSATLFDPAIVSMTKKPVAHLTSSAHISEVELTDSSPDSPVRPKDKLKKKPVSSKSSNVGGWVQDDVSRYKAQDFDFQSNLQLFDKKKIFQEIKSNDETKPGTLLVDINKKTKNLGINENVLNISSLPKFQPHGLIVSEDMFPDAFKVIGSEIGVPAISSALLNSVEQLAVHQTGPNVDQITENAGHSTAQVILHILGGGSTRFTQVGKNNSAKVLIVTNNQKLGAFSLCAGRHLVNRGLSVSALVVGEDASVCFHTQSRQFQACGGNFLPDINVLLKESHGYDLVVDAMTTTNEVDFSTLSRSSLNANHLQTCDKIISYCNSLNAPKLSFVIPTGYDATTGKRFLTDAMQSKWVVSFGLPVIGLTKCFLESQIFLIDIGLPTKIFDRFRIAYQCPFGDKFIVPLEETAT